MRHSSVPVLVTLWLSALAATAQSGPQFAGRLYSEVYQGAPVAVTDATQKRALAYAGGQLRARRLLGLSGTLEVDGFVSARGRHVFETGRPFDPGWFLYQGHLALRHRAVTVARVGRQFIRSGLGARTADGLWLSVRPAHRWRLAGFIGARVDPLAPQNVTSLTDELYSGGRLTYRRGNWQVASAVQLEKRAGTWWRQAAGVDARLDLSSHLIDLRYYYDFAGDRTDELRLGYTLRPARAWRLALRYQLRWPRTWLDREWTTKRPTDAFEAVPRNAASMVAGLDFGQKTGLTAVISTIFTADHLVLRYGATLVVHGVSVAYYRREGQGPVHDRIAVRGRHRLHRTLTASAGFGLSQYNLDEAVANSDQRAASATLGANWQPGRRWRVETELQVFETQRVSNDLRCYARLEHRLGGGR